VKNIFKKTQSWLIHGITISGAVVGLWALYAIREGQFDKALILIIATVLIDGIDGPLARRFAIKHHIPDFDGALLDNIIDYFTWAVIPAFLLLNYPLFSPTINTACATGIVVASAYQFCCTDAKEAGFYFKRFPSLWSIVLPIAYLIHWPSNLLLLSLIILIACSFLPIYCAKPFTKARLCHNNKLNLILQTTNRAVSIAATILAFTILITEKLFSHNPHYIQILLSCCIFSWLAIIAITTHYKHTAKPHNG
jgi:phosphatidylcholine synthase